MNTEKRLFRRCPLEGDAIWVATHRPEATHSAINISMDGAALEYLPVAGNPINTKTISIIGFNEEFRDLRDIPCETVYDIDSLTERRTLSGRNMRIRGLKFKNLGSRQQALLKALLDLCFERFT